MIVLQAQNCEKAYIADPIFENVSFNLQEREKVGLVGPNGAGKSTLFRCLTGELALDRGKVTIAKRSQLGYLQQRFDHDGDTKLMDLVMSSFEDIIEQRQRLSEMEESMATVQGADLEELYDAYAKEMADYEEKGGYSIESRAKGIIRGLGFQESDESRLVSDFSGGERNRIELARLLLREPDILLLDEPTNHLDLEAIEWLESYLAQYPGALLIISHDRYFLDQTVDRILELNHKHLKSYTGNYSTYLRRKEEDEALQHKAFLAQQRMIHREEAFIERNRAGVGAKQARGRETRLAKIDRLEDVRRNKSLSFRTYNLEEGPRVICEGLHLNKSFNEKTLFENLSLKIERGDKIGLIGPNGCGKSTLVKILAGQQLADEGDVFIGPRVKMAYFDQKQSTLDPNSTVLDQILYHSHLDLPGARKELARMMFFDEDLDKKVRALSGGEKARLSMLLIFLDEPNFLIMDEPTNHLDILAKDLLEDFLDDFPGTFLVVSHDRYFLNQVTNKTWVMQNQSIDSYIGNYTYYIEKRNELLYKDQNTLMTTIDNKADKPQKRSLSRSKLRNENERLETKLAELEVSLEAIQAEMQEVVQQQPANYMDKYLDLNNQVAELQQSIESTYEAWAEVQEQLEGLME